MPTFLSDLPIYNAKASLAISQAGLDGDTPKANLMSSLKTTANDETLSNDLRLSALTALINVGNLLDIPLPPYFPIAVTYANTVTYVGLHDNLTGLQGGGPGEYYHLTSSERSDILNKVSPDQLRFANLVDSPLDNPQLDSILIGKQNALSGPGFVKANSGVITYDNSTYLTNISTIAAGGDLGGFYPNPTISSSVVMGKQMAGWNPSYPSGTGAISSADTLLVAIQKLNVSLSGIIANPSGVSSVALNLLPNTIFDSTTTPASGAVVLGASFKSQSANTFLAAPNGVAGTPTFRVMAPDDVPNLGVSPAGTYGGGSPLQIPVITVDAKGRVTAVSLTAATGSGTVTSVGIDPPNYISAGAAVTVSGNISLAWQNTITPNYVFAGPNSGSTAGAPTFRPLVALDIPTGIPQANIAGLPTALANKLDNSLNDGEIWIGNSVTAPTMRSLTQDILITNTGVVTIQPNVVDFSKMQEITGTDTSVIPNIKGNLLGRWAAGIGEIQEVELSGDFNLNVGTGVLSLAVPVAPVLTTKGGLITYSASVGAQVQLAAVYEGRLLMTDSAEDKGIKWVEAQGDIEVDTVALDGTFNIKANAVTLGKMADLTQVSFLGSNAAGPYPVDELTPTVATAMLDQFTTSAKGLVPAASFTPVAPNVLADYFLNASGGWSLGGGGGGGTPGGSANQIQYNNTGSFGGTPNMEYVSGFGIYTTASSFYLADSASARNYSIGFSISAVTGDEVWSFPNASSTFVGTDVSQTLTYKTLSTGSKINIGATASQYDMWYSFDSAGTIAAIAGNAANIGKYLKYSSIGPIWSDVPGGGSGGASVSYYLNGSVIQGTFGGVVDCREISSTPIFGGGTDFIITTNGYIQSFITDANVPNQLLIPAGNWNFETYFSASSGGGSPSFYIELYKWNGTTLTLIAKNDTNPEYITGGTNIDLYFTALAVEETILTATDRIVVRFYVNNSGKDITMHTEGTHLSQVITTFTTGISSLNGLTAQTQLFATPTTSGTTLNWTSNTATHTLNIPLASVSGIAGGLISNADYLAFSAASGGDVVGPVGSVIDGNFAVFGATGQIIKESSAVNLSGGAVTLGASGTQGILVFNDGTTVNTTTLRAANNSGSTSYIFPTSNGSNTNVLTLSNATTGQLAWSATGTGDITRAGTSQIVTGNIAFNQSALILRNIDATRTATLSLLSTTGTAQSYAIVFPQASGTVALLEATQSWDGAQTFRAATTFSFSAATGTALTINAAAGGVTNPVLSVGAANTAAYMSFPNTTYIAAPSSTVRSAGTKIVLCPTANISTTSDVGLGIETVSSRVAMWLQGDGVIKFYPNRANSTIGAVGQFEIFTGTATALTPNVLGLHLNGNSTAAVPNLLISGAANNYQWLSFGSYGQVGIPSSPVRSQGTKIVLYQSTNLPTSLDAALGIETSNALWLSSPSNIKFYPNNSLVSAGQWAYNVSVPTNDGIRGLHLNSPSDINNLVSQLLISGTGSQSYTISFGSTPPLSAPTATGGTRGVGKKIVLQETTNTFLTTESAIGRETGYMWLCDPGGIRFYTQAGSSSPVTQRVQINSSGLTLAGTLFLRAGAAAAGSAPLAFTSGTNLTTPVNGSMEYNGTNLFFTRTGAVREGVLTQSAVTTEVLVSDTSVTINIGGTTYKLLAKA